MENSCLIFGCGYLGHFVARLAADAGWQVVPVTRSREKAKRLHDQGLEPIVADWNDRRTLQQLPSTDYVLISVGFDRQGRRSIRDVYVAGLRNALSALPAASRIVYCSTSGVYHHTDGRWVDETSPCHPTREGAKAHLEAEDLLSRRWPADQRVVLRLAGLYGPGRVPRLPAARQATETGQLPTGYLNLIHVEDAARCVLSAWQHPDPHSLYVVSDGSPAWRPDYYAEVARWLDAARPSPGESDAPQRPRSAQDRRNSDKRVDSRRMRRDLLPVLHFPSYREGLRSLASVR